RIAGVPEAREVKRVLALGEVAGAAVHGAGLDRPGTTADLAESSGRAECDLQTVPVEHPHPQGPRSLRQRIEPVAEQEAQDISQSRSRSAHAESPPRKLPAMNVESEMNVPSPWLSQSSSGRPVGFAYRRSTSPSLSTSAQLSPE